jgi:hypothetical protein
MWGRAIRRARTQQQSLRFVVHLSMPRYVGLLPQFQFSRCTSISTGVTATDNSNSDVWGGRFAGVEYTNAWERHPPTRRDVMRDFFGGASAGPDPNSSATLEPLDHVSMDNVTRHLIQVLLNLYHTNRCWSVQESLISNSSSCNELITTESCNNLLDQLWHLDHSTSGRASRALHMLKVMELFYGYELYHYSLDDENDFYQHDQFDFSGSDRSDLLQSKEPLDPRKVIHNSVRRQLYAAGSESASGSVDSSDQAYTPSIASTAGKTSKPFRLPRLLPTPNNTSYVTVLKILARTPGTQSCLDADSAPQRAQTLVEQMEYRWRKSDSTLSSSVPSHGDFPDVTTPDTSPLVSLEEAELIQPTVFHWNFVLRSYAESGDWERSVHAAKLFFSKLSDDSNFWDHDSYVTMLRCCVADTASFPPTNRDARMKASRLGSQVALKAWHSLFPQQPSTDYERFDSATELLEARSQGEAPRSKSGVAPYHATVISKLPTLFYTSFVQAIRPLSIATSEEKTLRDRYFHKAMVLAAQQGRVTSALVKELLINAQTRKYIAFKLL